MAHGGNSPGRFSVLLSWTIALLTISSNSGPPPKAWPSTAASCAQWPHRPQPSGLRISREPCRDSRGHGLRVSLGATPILRWALASLAAAGAATSAPMVASAYTSCSTGKATARLYGCGPTTFQGITGGATISSSADSSSSNTTQDPDADLQARSTKDRYLVKLQPGTPPATMDLICSVAQNSSEYEGKCIYRYNNLFVGALILISGPSLGRLLANYPASFQFVEMEGTALVASLPFPETSPLSTPSSSSPSSTKHRRRTRGWRSSLPGTEQQHGHQRQQQQRYPRGWAHRRRAAENGSDAVVASASSSAHYRRTKGPPWGLDRIDQKPGKKALDGYYGYSTAPGTPVHVYVVDTGIRCSHTEFQYLDGRRDARGRPASRCLAGFSAIRDGGGTADCNGHGSHCAGIVAGLECGVAKQALVHPVRVMGCDGSGAYGDIIAGLEWVADNYIAPAVVSLSIAMPASISLDTALSAIIRKKGIVGVVAAGNFRSVACNYSPADSPSVITVAAMTETDSVASFTNFGSCVSLFAPGENIESVDASSDTGFKEYSGTSQACPYVAGAAALYLSKSPSARPADVRRAILDTSFLQAVTGQLLGTPNRLLSVNFRDPVLEVSPRTITSLEGSAVTVAVSLLAAPSRTVTFSPSADDPSIVTFSPKQLVFTKANWKTSQTVTAQINYNPDFLDHSTVLALTFQSRDGRFQASYEGFLQSLDRDVCKAPCGQTLANPKVIPRLPFYYEDDTTLYADSYGAKFDSCHDSGKDVVFQYRPAHDMVVSVDLCAIASFDTILSAYRLDSRGGAKRIACNDDFCGVQSKIASLSLKGGTTYAFIVDGWAGVGGPFSFNMVQAPGSPALNAIRARSLEDSTPQPLEAHRRLAETLRRQGYAGALRWSTTRGAPWGPCSSPCLGGVQVARAVCLLHTLPAQVSSSISNSNSNISSTSSRSISNNSTSMGSAGGHAGAVQVVPSAACRAAGLRAPRARRRACGSAACPQFRLMFGAWGECSATCGAGTQQRLVWCADAQGAPVSRRLCPQPVSASETSRDCNTKLCGPTFWAVPRWQPCNVPCGGGVNVRPAVCVENVALRVLDASRCAGAPPPTNRSCNTQPCAVRSWKVGPWSACTSNSASTSNSNSTSTSNSTSSEEQGTPLDADGEPRAASRGRGLRSEGHSWYAAPDLSYAWSEEMGSDWDGGSGGCSDTDRDRDRVSELDTNMESDSYGNSDKASVSDSASGNDGGGGGGSDSIGDGDKGLEGRSLRTEAGHRRRVRKHCTTRQGVRTRTVMCADTLGAPVASSLCAGTQPAAEQPCLLLSRGCTRAGPRASGGIPLAPSGTPAAARSCGGRVAADGGACCASPSAVLDREGQCCESGVLDACGVCNGPSMTVDSTGACCASGVRDARGLCCPSGRLDECGACDGDATSCLLAASLTLLLDPLGTSSSHLPAFGDSFQTGMSSLLLVVPQAVNVTALALNCTSLGPSLGSNPGCASGAVSGDSVQLLSVSFTAAAYASGTAPVVLALPDFREAVRASSAATSGYLGIPGASFLSLDAASRAPVCGNGVCEYGERCGARGAETPGSWQGRVRPSPTHSGNSSGDSNGDSSGDSSSGGGNDTSSVEGISTSGVEGNSSSSNSSGSSTGISNSSTSSSPGSSSITSTVAPGGFHSDADTDCCPADCPFPNLPCPAPATGPLKGVPCAAHGRCLDSSGACDCFYGFGGGDCSSCLPGFVRLTSTGACFKIPQMPPHATNSTSNIVAGDSTGDRVTSNSTRDSGTGNSTGDSATDDSTYDSATGNSTFAIITNSTGEGSIIDSTSAVAPSSPPALAPFSSHRQLISSLSDTDTTVDTPQSGAPRVPPQSPGTRDSGAPPASLPPAAGVSSSLARHPGPAIGAPSRVARHSSRRELSARECIMVCCVASAAAFLGLSLLLLRHYRRRILRLSGSW